MIRLSVIIVSYNSAQFLVECLASVLEQTNEFPSEVLLVDNSSSDGSREIVGKNFPGVKLIANEENAGFAKANNLGIASSAGEYLLFLNPDTKLLPGAIRHMIERMEALPAAGLLGPKVLNGDGSLQRTGVSFPSLWNVLCETFFLDEIFPRSRLFARHRKLYRDPDTERAVDYLQGSCLLARRKALEASGTFDEGYFMYFEENDLSRRLLGRGWQTVYAPSASVIHYGGSGIGYYTYGRLLQYHRSYLLYLTKHKAPVARSLIRGALALRASVRCLVFALKAAVGGRRRKEYLERMRGYGRAIPIVLGFVS